MNRTIWKFPLEITGYQELDMPRGAVPLSVGIDAGRQVCLWARVCTVSAKEKRAVVIYGTGHPCEADLEDFVGTVVDGSLVWHVFVQPA